jgi:hypothetical protein
VKRTYEDAVTKEQGEKRRLSMWRISELLGDDRGVITPGRYGPAGDFATLRWSVELPDRAALLDGAIPWMGPSPDREGEWKPGSVHPLTAGRTQLIHRTGQHILGAF